MSFTSLLFSHWSSFQQVHVEEEEGTISANVCRQLRLLTPQTHHLQLHPNLKVRYAQCPSLGSFSESDLVGVMALLVVVLSTVLGNTACCSLSSIGGCSRR